MEDERRAVIQALVEPILAGQGMEPVEMTCRMQGGQMYLRFLVDRVGGVTIQQCARANRLISSTLEEADLIEGSYTVEVSSPGLDRPLASPRDFERALGEEVRVDWQAGEGRVSELQGMLLAVQPEAIVLKTEGGNLTVPFAQLRAAKKVIHFAKQHESQNTKRT